MISIKNIVNIINNLGIKSYTFDYNIYNNYIETWYSWYKGYDRSFHTYKDNNGLSDKIVNKSKLNMASQVCRDHASLTCNENLSFKIEGLDESKFILGSDEMTGLLGHNNFWTQLSKLYELTCALGTGSFEVLVDNLLYLDNKILVNDNSKLRLVFHNALGIVPLTWDNNGNIIDVAFIDQYKIKDDNYLDMRIHVLEDSGYVIYNRKLKVFGDNLYTELKDDNLFSKFETGSDIPWFSVLKLPLVNNYDINSPMGISVYGNALDVLKNVDDAFNALTTEYRSCSKKIFYNKAMLDKDDNGRPVDPDRLNKTLFYYVGDSNAPSLSSDIPIKEFVPDVRVEQLTKGLESALSYLSALCGLGNSYYKFTSGSVVKTATEVISENSSMYRNIRKNEIAVEKFLIDFLHSILNVSNLIYGTSFDVNTPISVMFDASIIEDKNSIRERDLKEVQLGIMSIDEYREKWYTMNRRDTVD